MHWFERHQLMLDVCEGMEFLHSPVYPSGKSKLVSFNEDQDEADEEVAINGGPACYQVFRSD
jgi:hypothetical protein